MFAVSLIAGKGLYTIKAPAGNVMIRVFKIMGVRKREAGAWFVTQYFPDEVLRDTRSHCPRHADSLVRVVTLSSNIKLTDFLIFF